MQAPTSVIVFGILNIIFGILGVLGTAFSAVTLFALPGGNPFLANQDAFMATWLRVSIVLGFLASIVLLISGIGLLRLRPWGHKLAIGYAIYGVASTILGIIIQVWFVVLPQLQQPARGPDAMPLIAGAIGGAIGGCIGLAHPVLLWFFMTRRNVVAAFAGTAMPEEPFDAQLVPPLVEGSFDFNNPYASPRTTAVPLAMDAPPGSVDSMVDRMIPAKNGPALASYYLGLFSLLPCFGFPLGAAAVYFGIKGLQNVRANPEVRGGVHAWVGVICGGLFGMLNLLLVILFVVGIVVSATGR